MKGRVLVLLLAGVLVAAAGAQSVKPETVVKLRLEPARVQLAPGGAAEIALVATIREGFHINSNKPAADYLIPSKLELAGPAPAAPEASGSAGRGPGFDLEKVSYPAGELKSFEFAPDEKLSVYEGTVKISAQLRAKRETPAGTHAVRLTFHFQACNDQICLRPARGEVMLPVEVLPTR